MKKHLKSILGAFGCALLAGGSLLGGEPQVLPSITGGHIADGAIIVNGDSYGCTPCEVKCEEEESLFRVHGWIDQGFTWNYDNPNNRRNFPTTFNWRSNDYMLNQAYLYVEKALDPCKFDVGGRIDVLWGTDYVFTTARGLETEGIDGTQKWNGDNPEGLFGADMYGVALPQFYAEVGAPIAGHTSIKVGHFYTPIGYEGVMSTSNFFYSHSYSHQWGQPFTHTGLLSTTNLNDNISLWGGIVRGWDQWEDVNNGWSLLSGVTIKPTCSTTLRLSMITGPEHFEPRTGFETEERDRTLYNAILEQKIGEKLRAVAEYTQGWEEDAALSDEGTVDSAEWYGATGYLFYDLTCKLTAGLRFEWFRDDDGIRVPTSNELIPNFNFLGAGSDFYNITAGLNIKPIENLIIRPEVRYDWVVNNSTFFPYVDDTQSHQTTIGTSVIVRF